MPSIKSRTGLLFLLIFISLFPAVNSAAQAYYPFPDSNAIWNTAAECNSNNHKWEIRFGLRGDTVIGQKAYFKVYRLVDSSLTNPKSKYFAAIREESKKIFMHLSGLDSIPGIDDFLLYDFTKQPGDTIFYPLLIGYVWWQLYEYFYFVPNPHFTVIGSVDSVLIRNSYRKQWHLLTGPDYSSSIKDSTWVEGIGTTNWFGLLGPVLVDNYIENILRFACFKQNDTVLFENNMNCASCFCDDYVMTVPGKEKKESLCTLSYLHGTGLRIEVPAGSGSAIIDIHDVTGKEVRHILLPEGISEISMNDCPPGLYIAVSKTSVGSVPATQKFVVGD
jgi:hypothetical protein